jgi:hypothetical protein
VKSVIAGVAGVLVATLGVAAWQARTAAPAYRVSNVAGFADAAATLPIATTAAQGLPLAVRCAPGQQAVMRQIVVGGQLTAAAECTDAAMPVAYGASLVQPVSSDIVQWQQPRVVPASYTVRERAPRRVVVREGRKRNWGKTALVIGGSAGAGAGVGAIAGGKKGALIGAAIGGGAASLFEALKK